MVFMGIKKTLSMTDERIMEMLRHSRIIGQLSHLSAWMIAFAVTALWAGLLHAQTTDPAGAGFQFLTIGGGARAVGLAETMVSDGEDPFVMEYNPAGLSALEKTTVSFSHSELYFDSRGEYVSAGVPHGPWAFGGRAGYLGSDDFPLRTGPTVEPLGYYDASSGVFQGGVARRISAKVALGFSAAYVIEHIDNSTAQNSVFGLGLRYTRSEHLAFGASFINVGPETHFEERDFSMPNRFRAGGSYLYKYVSLRGELVAPDNENAKWHFGAEATPDPRLALRAGVKLGYDTQVFAAGFGVRTADGRFGIDYAYAPYSTDFGTTHRYGLSIRP